MTFKDPIKQKEYMKKYNADYLSKHREKILKQHREWKANNPEKVKEINRKYRTNHPETQKRCMDKRRKWILEIKTELFCKKCGERRFYCLDFHHRDPNEKDFKLSSAIYKYSRKRILEEITKCDVLCANCHREYHWQEAINRGEEDELSTTSNRTDLQ
jgi:hypothetical protein